LIRTVNDLDPKQSHNKELLFILAIFRTPKALTLDPDVDTKDMLKPLILEIIIDIL